MHISVDLSRRKAPNADRASEPFLALCIPSPEGSPSTICASLLAKELTDISPQLTI